MSSMSFILIVIVILIAIDSGETATKCPTDYNDIAGGCYKINNGTKLTWSNAHMDCLNETDRVNHTAPNATVHLVALEGELERNALFYWMKAWGVAEEFWTDGMVSASQWSWINQSIVWYFKSEERSIIGNGTNYKVTYNINTSIYQIADDIDSHPLNYICEYQMQCNNSTKCLNGGTCFINPGQEFCVCAPGFTGEICKTDIDECLSSPCLHGGICIDGRNNYTCNCSDIFYSGANCEIVTTDEAQTKRVAAFWSVVGVVTALVVILTLSDLPWEDILTAIGCSGSCFNCCSKETNHGNLKESQDLHLSDSPINDYNSPRKSNPISYETTPSKGTNYHVMNTVWDPERINSQTSRNPQYNGYRSPNKNKTPDNALIQSFASATIAKQKEKELEDKRIYAVNINDTTKSTRKSKDHVDTMVNWTQQLQEQLKNKNTRESSASSTQQLIHSSNTNDY